ncbi:MAG TPA: MBL fold metallo-hydrolase [Gammaproteobacteria bacterium]|nr:MBL fold metallo-hydrolase [Gammaproteobacteria bacterium]
MKRRRFISLLGGAGAAGLLGGRELSLRAQTAPGPLAMTELRSGLQLVTGAGGNVVARAGTDGLTLVDSGSPESATALRKALTERLGSAPVTTLFNTHWHLDHTGGNDALVEGHDATIIAHENTRLWMSTEFDVEWEEKHYERRGRASWPNKTFFSSDKQPLTVDLGEKITYGHLSEAHTDGDIYVQFPDTNVIVAGGAVTAGRYPLIDYITGGWIGGMADATTKLLGMMDAETLVVPDLGPVQRRADLEAQVKMLQTVRERIEGIALQGRGIEDMVAEAITKDFDARYAGDPAKFIEHAYESMWWSRLRGIVA